MYQELNLSVNNIGLKEQVVILDANLPNPRINDTLSLMILCCGGCTVH